MCYGKPRESLEIARSRLTPEQWSRFEREFEVFCVVQGLELPLYPGGMTAEIFDWARWAFFQGRQHQSTQCINCGMDIDPKCACSRGRAASNQIADAHYERLAIAMMDDEQREQSLERWKEGK